MVRRLDRTRDDLSGMRPSKLAVHLQRLWRCSEIVAGNPRPAAAFGGCAGRESHGPLVLEAQAPECLADLLHQRGIAIGKGTEVIGDAIARMNAFQTRYVPL